MPDYGARYTDREINRVERELHGVYRQAKEELEDKLNEFYQKHKARDRMKRKQLAEGEITRQEYQDWMNGQIFQREQWKRQIKQINHVLYDTNSQAVKIVNDRRLDVFAENYNYFAYLGEQNPGISFELYDARSVARLIRDHPQILPEWKIDEEKDYIWNAKKVNNIVTQGIIQGEGIEGITQRLTEGLSTQNENKMRMFARTAMTGAQNAGRQQCMEDTANMGVDTHKKWVATLDRRTRDSHRHLDGQEVPYNEDFESDHGAIRYPGDPEADPAEVFNCFIGETIATTDSDIIRSYKHYYSGELITVKSSCGVQFTCTPNHPILTDRGWVKAEVLNNSDHLVIARISNNRPSRVNPYINHTFPSMDTIHEFMNKFTGQRATSLRVNFHGDIPTTDVEIVTKKRFLRNNRNGCGRKHTDKLLLKHTNKALVCLSSLCKHFFSVRFSTLGNISRHSKPFSFFRGSVSHTDEHRFGTVTDFDTMLVQAQNNSISCDAEFFSKCFDGFPGGVFLDDVISINISSADHVPVYNLQTQNGYYFVNNIITDATETNNGNFAIAHNCRCTMVTIFPKYEDRTKRDWREDEIIDGQTYAEWKQGKKKASSGSGQEQEEIHEPLWYDNEIKRLQNVLDDWDDSKYNSYAESANEYTKIQDKIDELRNQKLKSKYPDDDVMGDFKKTTETKYTQTSKATNPKFNEGGKYTDNCSCCVVANEMRARGYDCIAGIADNNMRQFWWDDNKKIITGRGSWTDCFEGIQYVDIEAKRKEQQIPNIQKIMKQYGAGARAVVFVKWDRGGGHYFTVQNVNGEIRFTNPQNPDADAYSFFEYTKPSRTKIFRIDDKKATNHVKKAVRKKDE